MSKIILMKRRCTIILLFLFCSVCNAQNLLPNGSFEQYSWCPFQVSQIDSCLYWFNPATGTPDYFNSCGASTVQVPDNTFGYQQAHDGLAYAGIILRTLTANPNYREYIETPLLSTLVANECYHFECYCSLGNKMKYTTDALGVYFSDTIIHDITDYNPLTFTPQINNVDGNIFDTLNWTLVEGDYTAIGGENFIIIGNFKDDANTDTIVVNNSAPDPTKIYIYIDDVSLTQVSCITGVKENNLISSVKTFPNPMSDKLNIQISNNEPAEIILYDVTSRKLLEQNMIGSSTINMKNFSKGIYFYEVRNRNGEVGIGKVMKE